MPEGRVLASQSSTVRLSNKAWQWLGVFILVMIRTDPNRWDDGLEDFEREAIMGVLKAAGFDEDASQRLLETALER